MISLSSHLINFPMPMPLNRNDLGKLPVGQRLFLPEKPFTARYIGRYGIACYNEETDKIIVFSFHKKNKGKPIIKIFSSGQEYNMYKSLFPNKHKGVLN